MNEKTKTTLIGIGGCVIAALFIAFIFWLGRKSGQIGQFKNVEYWDHGVIVKDSTETKNLRLIVDSVTKENTRLKAFYTRKKSNAIKIKTQNEINKKNDLSASDSTAVSINDSLESRYAEILNQEKN